MRAVIQRVSEAAVSVDEVVIGQIKCGLVVLFAVGHNDQPADVEWFVNKILNLRIFSDENDKMNRSVRDVAGGLLVISQFTLYGNCAKGRRPDFFEAADPAKAEAIYEDFVARLKSVHPLVESGRFAAKMSVSLVNDGPVTLILNSADSLTPS